MKKLSVHLSLLCLLAFLVIPFAGCKKEEEPVEETPAATTETTMESTPVESTPAATTDTMATETTEPASTDATTPPASK